MNNPMTADKLVALAETAHLIAQYPMQEGATKKLEKLEADLRALAQSAASGWEERVRGLQRYTPRYGENPACKAHMTAIMVPDYYHGEYVRWSDLNSILAAGRDGVGGGSDG